VTFAALDLIWNGRAKTAVRTAKTKRHKKILRLDSNLTKLVIF